MPFRLLPSLLLLLACLTLSAVSLRAAPPAPAKPKPAPAAPASPIDGFDTTLNPDNIAPTSAMPTKAPEVEGQPKNETTHPNLMWDQEDVDHYKEMLKTNKELQIQFNVMKAKVDAQIAQPIEVPAPQKGGDGNYPFIGDTLPFFPNTPETDSAQNKFNRWFMHDSDMISDIATIYVLTGDEKYGDYAKKLLLAWAHANEWGHCANIRLRSGQGPMDQIFVEGLKMNHFAFAYDLIYNLKSWTPEERKQVHDDFFWPMADTWLYPSELHIDKEGSGGAFASQLNNRGMHTLESIYAMGIVTDDQELINVGLYGVHTDRTATDNAELVHFPPRKDWTAATADSPGHGLLNCFFTQKAIPGGVWIEGTPGYAFYALGSMIDAADIAWHHGVDLYRNDNGIFKCMFDFPLLLGYPDLTTPGLNDAHHASLLGGEAPALYEYAYRRYKDPKYLAMINPPAEKRFLALIANPAAAAKVQDELINPPPPPAPGTPPPPPVPESEKPPKSQRDLAIQSSKFGGTPPSFMYDLDPSAGTTLVPPPSVNYPLVGYGVLRSPSTSSGQPQQVILSSGPSASHGHPDKLGIDVYAINDILMPSPGINFPYQNPNIPKWLHTTLSHNTLTVDEELQKEDQRNGTVRADESIFAPCSTGGLQRAWTCSVYPGTTMDRAIFMRPNYMADIFGAFSGSSHKYDLAWHVRGDHTSDLDFSAEAPINKSQNGYVWFTSATAAAPTDKPWSITSKQGDKTARLVVAGGAQTQPIIGEGGIYVDDTSSAPGHRPTCPTIIERREVASTVYGNALDFSNGKDPYVKSVAQDGGFDKGYALLSVTTTDGTDLCFAAYRPGSYTAGGMKTDALQAYAGMKGNSAETLYLAGGTTLQAGDATISRSAPGLAYVEKALDGTYIVGNASPSAGTVKVMMPALAGLEAFTLDADGKKGAAATGVTINGSTITAQLAADSKIGLFKK